MNHIDLSQRRDPAAMGVLLPFTPGYEAAGTRVDTGERVLVTGVPGMYAELVAAPLENVWPIPDSLDSARAAALLSGPVAGALSLVYLVDSSDINSATAGVS